MIWQLAWLPLLLAAASGPSADASLDSLVAAERRFSATSVERGMRDAFLEFLADDGLIFRPAAVNGKASWQARGPVPGTLIWEPHYAEVSAAGDFGYTFGPWEYRPPADTPGASVAHGHFISVWKREGTGPWRVALDIGVGHPRPERGLGSGDFERGPSPRAKSGGAKRAQRELAAAEETMSREAQQKGVAQALEQRAAPDLRYFREGEMPRVGHEAARPLLPWVATDVRWRVQGSGAARSGDLGYSYGIREDQVAAAPAPPDSAVFVHVWRRGRAGRWRMTLAVENPLPRRR
jgi:ketosteroid isomerase-like protein